MKNFNQRQAGRTELQNQMGQRRQKPANFTGQSFDRVVNFSDAVVAIALTILVLPLTEIVPEFAGKNFGQIVSQYSEQFVAMAVSFFVIGRMWLSHHRLFDRLRAIDSTMVMLNLTWLFFIVMLPFFVELLVSDVDKSLALGLYVGNIWLNALVLGIINRRALRQSELMEEKGDDQVHSWTSVGFTTVIFGIVLAFPNLGVWPVVLFFFQGVFWRVLMFRGMRRSGGKNFEKNN